MKYAWMWRWWASKEGSWARTNRLSLSNTGQYILCMTKVWLISTLWWLAPWLAGLCLWNLPEPSNSNCITKFLKLIIFLFHHFFPITVIIYTNRCKPTKILANLSRNRIKPNQDNTSLRAGEPASIAPGPFAMSCAQPQPHHCIYFSLVTAHEIISKGLCRGKKQSLHVFSIPQWHGIWLCFGPCDFTCRGGCNPCCYSCVSHLNIHAPEELSQT